MTQGVTRQFYECPRSGTWELVREERKVCVRNLPPETSVASQTDYDIVSFLSLFHLTPQARELVELIGTLADEAQGRPQS